MANAYVAQGDPQWIALDVKMKTREVIAKLPKHTELTPIMA